MIEKPKRMTREELSALVQEHLDDQERRDEAIAQRFYEAVVKKLAMQGFRIQWDGRIIVTVFLPSRTWPSRKYLNKLFSDAGLKYHDVESSLNWWWHFEISVEQGAE